MRPLTVIAIVGVLLLAGCHSVKTAPDPQPTTFTNPVPSLLPTRGSTVPPTVGEVH